MSVTVDHTAGWDLWLLVA